MITIKNANNIHIIVFILIINIKRAIQNPLSFFIVDVNELRMDTNANNPITMKKQIKSMIVI